MMADPNYLYKEVFDAVRNLKELSAVSDDVTEERRAIYRAFKGVTGLGDPVQPRNKAQGIKGILQEIFGNSPKYGTVQRKLLGSTVDLVGRATITPNPELDMDHVGLPVDKAWTLYRPFITRRLVRSGMPRVAALKAVTDRSERATKALQTEISERPVIITRAPVLHRYGVMAFWPQLTSSNTLEIPPLVTGGFSCVGHVPVMRNGQFEIIDLADFPHGAAIPDEPNAYSVPDDIQVLMHVSGGFAWRLVDRYYVHPQLQAVDVTIGRNRRVTVSHDHSLYCFDAALGKCRRMPPHEALDKLSPRVVIAPIGQSTITGIVGPYGKRLPLTESLGWWLGVVIGDGWVSQSKGHIKGICLAGSRSSAIMSEWPRISFELLGKATGKSQDRDAASLNGWGECRKLTINSTALGRWVSPLIGSHAAGKHLPAWFGNAPSEFQQGLLAGLLDTDGHVKRSATGRFNIALTTTSRQLAYEVVWLFASHGVDANAHRYRNVQGRWAWTVNPALCDIVNLPLQLRMLTKQQGFNELAINAPNGKFINDVVPITKAECNILTKQYTGTAATRRPPNRDIHAFREYVALSKATHTGCIGRYVLAAIIARVDVGIAPEALLARFHGNEKWERVRHVEVAGVRDMYDLRVPGGSYTFVLDNKLCVFDSADFDGDAMQFHVPGQQAAVDEAKEKLLPSQNLLNVRNFDVHYMPTMEFVGGLWAATSKVSKSPTRVFGTKADAIRAYRQGKIDVGQRIEVVEA